MAEKNKTEKLADQIHEHLATLPEGSLRFWGVWFGRPYDNVHKLTGCQAEGSSLRLLFNEAEVLTITDPEQLVCTNTILVIANASKVRWEWFSYGKPKIASNLYFESFERCGDQITATTNIDWYEPELNPNPAEPAVAIVSI